MDKVVREKDKEGEIARDRERGGGGGGGGGGGYVTTPVWPATSNVARY